MATYEQYDTGVAIPVVSLGGIVGNRGRVLRQTSVSAVLAYAAPFSDNPKRISMLLQNLGPEIAYVTFVDALVATVYLTAYASFQIDQSFPWTGAVRINSTAVGTVVLCTEISVK